MNYLFANLAMPFKKKISNIQYFLCLEFVLISLSSFQKCEAKICQFLVNCVIFAFLSPPYLLAITIMVCEKILKNKDIYYAP